MLNTDLHNPSVREKMTLENFHYITSGMSVDRETVTAIYNTIRLEPFKFPEASADPNDSLPSLLLHSDKQGWLMKQGSRYKLWNKRWFVLHSKCLYYFEQPQAGPGASDNDLKEPRGIIPLDSLRVRVVTVEDGWSPRPNTFEIYSPRGNERIKACKRADSEGRLVEGQHQVYRMAAADQQEMLSWISAIQ